MKFRFCYILVLFALFGSCKKDSSESDITKEIDAQLSSIEDMVVPNGFNYSNLKSVSVNLTMIDSAGQKAAGVLTRIIGMIGSESQGAIVTGFSQENGAFQIDLQLPNHYTDIVVQTSIGAAIRSKTYPLVGMVTDEIEVNGNLLMVDDRGLNCYPNINGSFSNNNKRVGVTSTKAIEAVTLGFGDGTSELINFPTNYRTYSNFVVEVCNDGIDNDGDGLVDCADPQCGVDETYCNGGMPCLSSFFQTCRENAQTIKSFFWIIYTYWRSAKFIRYL